MERVQRFLGAPRTYSSWWGRRGICIGILILIFAFLPFITTVFELYQYIRISEWIADGNTLFDESDLAMASVLFQLSLVMLILVVFVGIVILRKSVITGRSWKRVTSIASAHEKLSLDEISRQAEVPLTMTRSIIYAAIANKTVRGSLKDDIYYRAERYIEPTSATVEKLVEREVMVSRKVPETCFKCGATIKPNEVSWLGPDNVECPHCGASLKVTTERV